MAPIVFVVLALICGAVMTVMTFFAIVKSSLKMAWVALGSNILCWVFVYIALIPWTEPLLWAAVAIFTVAAALIFINVRLIRSLQHQLLVKKIQTRFKNRME